MAIRRYARTPKINAGRMYGTARSCYAIYQGVQTGTINASRHVSKEGERLDILAGRSYGDARLWWVIAAASGVGWSLQVPPGTILYLPSNLGQIAGVVG